MRTGRKNRWGMKKNNAGMSLIEIVIVIAMIAILAGTGLYGVGQLGGFRAREGADTIASSIAGARVAILGKAKSNGDMAWEIYRKGDRYYVRTVYDISGTEYYRDEKQIVDGGLSSVEYGETTAQGPDDQTGSGSLEALQDNSSYRVYFNRATGAVCDSSGNEVSKNIYFRVTQGSKDYEVYIISKTGKIISQTVKR